MNSEKFENNSAMWRPTVTFRAITFSDGKTIELEEDDIVVLVGPNNSGKSLALKELEQHLNNPPTGLVIKEVKLHHTGTQGDFLALLQEQTDITIRGASYQIKGAGFSLSGEQSPDTLWPHNIGWCYRLFCVRIDTESRITASNPAEAIDVSQQRPTHPIHRLYEDDQLELRISNYFERAFGQALILDQRAGSQLPLRVGNRLQPAENEDRLSATYWTRTRATSVLLQEQGDGMRSFATVILHLLAPISPSVLLLDEPEAFLHPPQARILGEIIATEKSPKAQLIVATHSSDVLQGLLDIAPTKLRLLRIQREGTVNRTKELERAKVEEITKDPLMKYSSALAGLFHERVIICESDSDCMFYSSLLDTPSVHGGKPRDVLFTHANGKDRMAVLAKALRALDVQVDVIADMDLLRQEKDVQKLIEALDGDWSQAQTPTKVIKSAVDQLKPHLDSVQVKQTIEAELKKAPPSGEFPRSLRNQIESILRKASSWEAIKSAGQAAIPPAQPTQSWKELQTYCNSIGLWIVPVGEVEGFCKSIGNHGPRWVQQVLEEKNLALEPELEDSRAFMREIWARHD